MPNIDSTTPWADTAEDVTTRTIPLEGGTAIVEHVDNRAEVTIRLGDRIICAVALSTSEAQQIGMALARPGGWTVGDYWDIHDQLYPTGVYARPDSLATGGAR